MRFAPLLALPPIALGIAVAFWMISSAQGPAQVEGGVPALPVRAMTVTVVDIRPTASAWGNLRAAESWVAVAEVQGEVIWRHPNLEPGHLIPAGTGVLRIDPTDYELALAQSQADLAVLEAELAQLAAEAENTRGILVLEQDRLALAEADLERTRALVEQGAIPQSRLDEAERATLLARRTVVELENTLSLFPLREAQITAQVTRSEAAIARAERSLARTTLTTPYDLRVTEVSAERFQTVAPGQIVIRGDGIAVAEVVAHLPIDVFRRLLGGSVEDMTFADMMRGGLPADVDVTLSPLSDPAQTWAARVTGIEGALDARARTVPVVVTVDDPYEGAHPPRRLPLVPNMQVGLTFSGAPLPEAIAIPEAALHAGVVRIATPDDVLELRPVTPAFAQEGRVIIAQGLAAGDRVVIDDIAPAIPGMPLNVVEGLE